MNSKRHRKPDLLLFLAVFVTLGVVVTTTAYGAERAPDLSVAGDKPALGTSTARAAARQFHRVSGRLQASLDTLLGEARGWWDTGLDVVARAAGPGLHIGRPDAAHVTVHLGTPAYVRPTSGDGTRDFDGPTRLRVGDRTLFILSVGSRW